MQGRVSSRVAWACAVLCSWSTLSCGNSDESKQPSAARGSKSDGAPSAERGRGDGDQSAASSGEQGAASDAEQSPARGAGERPAGDSAEPSPGAPPSEAEGSAPGSQPSGAACAARAVAGAPGVHFHHVHFNTQDPSADLKFFELFLDAPPEEFCRPEGQGAPTLATRTERGWFLYSQVADAPDPALNTYLEHVGWINPDPNAELQRLVQLGAPRYPVGRAQCQTAFDGDQACNNFWFYLLAPSGARIEVARGPGPALTGFGHVHLIMGVDFAFFQTALGPNFAEMAIDMVNHTDVALTEDILANEQVTETRGKPIDHLGYSTTDLEGEKERILAAGLTLAEDISFKPEFGFRSFFLKSEKGIWIELVEDTAFSFPQ